MIVCTFGINLQTLTQQILKKMHTHLSDNRKMYGLQSVMVHNDCSTIQTHEFIIFHHCQATHVFIESIIGIDPPQSNYDVYLTNILDARRTL